MDLSQIFPHEEEQNRGCFFFPLWHLFPRVAVSVAGFAMSELPSAPIFHCLKIK